MSIRLRRLAPLVLAITAAFALSGCGTGFGAQTNQQYQAAVGTDDRASAIEVLGAMLVTNPDGSATVSASVVNNSGSDVVLTDVTVTTLAGEPLPVISTPFLLPLPDGRLTRLGVHADAGGYVVIAGASAGGVLRVTLSFSAGASVTLEVPVVARTAIYDSISRGITAS